ncbi:hypothetical protein OESDEN_24421 [Oesophagostomum dentatum]|uniref:Uncharacterized protein n=1 Tax=Oesophagostomum dentatum TaxID=61180 RepID=A0A0B1RY55_OESDE|nr:hypothetical protein OESDEN_24421 [Oesophagostomum dentatum]
MLLSSMRVPGWHLVSRMVRHSAASPTSASRSQQPSINAANRQHRQRCLSSDPLPRLTPFTSWPRLPVQRGCYLQCRGPLLLVLCHSGRPPSRCLQSLQVLVFELSVFPIYCTYSYVSFFDAAFCLLSL